MVTITAADLAKQFGKYRDIALREPVSVTHHGRETLVMLAADEYKRLKTMEEGMDKDRKAAMAKIFDTHKGTFEKLALR
jgi:PHD/YefM family antitoxin component YafN of YafNO toxin-antitoxin module